MREVKQDSIIGRLSGASAAEWDKMDFLVSWEAMRESLRAGDEELRSLLSTLRNPKVFADLPLENVVEAFQRMDAVHFSKGDIIMEQGGPGDYFYIIKQGILDVWQMGLYDTEQRKVAVRGIGEHIGEEALVTGGTRGATVKAVVDGMLLRLAAEDFRELITKATVQEVDAASAAQMLRTDHRALDVRYQEEYEEAHLPNVQLIPLPELRDRLDELDAANRYVTVCRSGKRSAVAAMILRQNGFAAVSMKGGIRDWPGEVVSAC